MAEKNTKMTFAEYLQKAIEELNNKIEKCQQKKEVGDKDLQPNINGIECIRTKGFIHKWGWNNNSYIRNKKR
jgi:hypothetical protein